MLAIRPWQLEDAKFIISLRNNPKYNEWFRQECPITLEEQVLFMTHSPNYQGHILLEDNKPVGVFALNKEELCIVAPVDYHIFGIRLLEKALKPKRMWGEVFFGNPALPLYLENGFKAKQYRLNRYIKKGQTVDVTLIEKRCEY